MEYPNSQFTLELQTNSEQSLLVWNYIHLMVLLKSVTTVGAHAHFVKQIAITQDTIIINIL